MGKKYSINSAGRIVAERDIYSLGGFIPKGSVGGKVANELQLSQDGECWLAGGDFSNQENIRVKDNAYIETPYITAAEKYKDTEVSVEGNSRLYGEIGLHPLISYKSGIIIRDSYAAVDHDLLCTPATNTAGFPFESGSYDADAAKGTPLANMKLANASFCRSIRESQEGKETYVYFPSGITCRILWLYKDTDGALKYSGETVSLASNYARIYHPVYKYFVFYFHQVGLTIDTLESKGCRLIGRPSSSSRIIFYPVSASGMYTLINSNFRIKLNVWTEAVQVYEWLAGSAYNCDIEVSKDQNSQIFGTFSNINRLEISRPGSGSTNANRDRFVTASDCPLLRIDTDTYGQTIMDSGAPLVFRNCIVPKAMFTHNKVLGDTYENIDFSYAADFSTTAVANGEKRSSHTPGHYDVFSLAPSNNHVATISRPENAEASTVFGGNTVDLYLDGDIIEQGTYSTLPGQYYEDTKVAAANRVRTRVPVSTSNASLPTMPSGFKVVAIYYLDNSFIMEESQVDPTAMTPDYPYCILTFGKTDNSAITPKDFISLNTFIRSYDYTHVPFISGSGYAGAGVILRGDVQVIGQPYVDRIYDRNLWELGSITTVSVSDGWEQAKNAPGATTENDRLRFKELIPVKPGSVITCADGFNFIGYFYAEDGSYIMARDWGITTTAPDNAAYLGMILRKGTPSGTTITLSDLVSAHVRCVEPFKTARYITNEIDRKDPSDIFLSQDAWQVSAISTGQSYIGRKYDSLKQASNKWCILKRPINAGKSWTVTLGNNVTYIQANSSWDGEAILLGLGVVNNAALTGLELKKAADEIITLLDVPAGRFVVEYVPTPRIIVPYGATALWIEKTRVRLYDNAVINKSYTGGEKVILTGNSVSGYVTGFVNCICANGHDDAIIKLP